MPISAIDASTVAPRSAEASSLVGKEQQQVQHVGENGAVSFQHNVQQNSRRTVETAKSETDEYDYEEGSGSGQYQSRRKKKKKEGKEPPVAPRSNSSFDIMV